MPFPFTLPTTSPVSYPTYFTSPLYPSLPLLTSSHRGSLRNALKAHKRLSPASQNANLPHIISELKTYTSHLLALVTALEVNDAFLAPTAPQFTTSWRAVLTSKKLTSTEPPRVTRPGLSYEIFWTLSTLGYAYTLLARSQLLQVLSPEKKPSLEPQQIFNQASANLFTGASIFTHLLSRAQPTNASSWPIELTTPSLSALSSLNLADATLIAVIKQDPYPTYISLTARTKDTKNSSKDWLYNPPDPPTSVRALLLARLCIAASDHASKARGLLSTSNTKRQMLLQQLRGKSDDTTVPGEVSEDLLKYIDSLYRVCRAKSCRFLGIDAEASGRCGEAISWILLAKSILTGSDSVTSTPSSSSSPSSLSKIRKNISSRKEAQQLASSSLAWGLDAGHHEESLVLSALEVKWKKLNDSVMFQTLPDTAGLMARLPSGREIRSLEAWEAPKLGADEMRALRTEGVEGYDNVMEDDSEDEGEGGEVEAEYAGKGGYY